MEKYVEIMIKNNSNEFDIYWVIMSYKGLSYWGDRDKQKEAPILRTLLSNV